MGEAGLAECYSLDLGWASIIVEVLEGPVRVDMLPGLERRGGVAVGFTKGEDPGPCAVALAYIYAGDDRALGSSRVRNPGIHVKMISVGAKQISEVTGPGEFDKVYLVYWASRERGHRCCGKLVCNPEVLERVTAVRVRSMR